MKTYSGKYKVKNRKKYSGDVDEVIYRSHWEKNAFIWCDENKSVKQWSSEEIVVPYFYEVDRKYHRYFVDLKIVFEDGKTVLVEIKPERQTKPPKGKRRTKQYIQEGFTYVKNMNKWEAATEYAKDRGWLFEIWTERELKKIGILPKLPPVKKLQPMEPFRKKKKPKK